MVKITNNYGYTLEGSGNDSWLFVPLSARFWQFVMLTYTPNAYPTQNQNPVTVVF